MSKTQDATPALDKYTRAMDALKEHQSQNKAIFDVHQNLVMNVIDAENELRDTVAQIGLPVSNGLYNVTITRQTQTFADIEVLDSMVSRGAMLQGVRDTIVKTVQRPPRITISAIKG